MWLPELEIALENGKNIESILDAVSNIDHDKLDTIKKLKNIRFQESLHLITPNTTLLNFARQVAPNSALVSSAKKMTINKVFDHFGIESPFSIEITYETTKNHKPSPEPYLVSIQKAGLGKIHIAVEDSQFGKESALTAGMLVIDAKILTKNLEGSLL
jgi:beta-phosphoglucomutase-like phosphatase (HAD superfamily)